MKKTPPEFNPTRVGGLFLSVCTAALLSACISSGDGDTGSQQAAAPLASATTTLQLDVATLPDAAANLVAQPAFHVAPALLDEPGDTDKYDRSASALARPHRQAVPAALENLSSRHLTVQAMETARHKWATRGQTATAAGSATPMATSGAVTVYSPAQIRAAYGLPTLPAAGAAVSAAQAAQMGAGQTIYVIAAMNDPNIAAELAAFNQKFGLPTCAIRTIATTSAMPLAPASSGGCELAVVYSKASGTLSATAPAYDSGWATEIALDVQWSHATAPLARIVVVEAADASFNSLLGAIKLANAMGPGVVSMSFGGAEGNWTSSVDSVFTAPNMTYLASTGDSGAGVQWPAVSPNVVAVGGTTLTYTGTGQRSEVSWSKTGGGVSQYTPRPSYQGSAVPGMMSTTRRVVADVAFNGDPATGQYVALLPPGSSSASWVSAGGTSLSAPQWAGIITVANALRAQAAKQALAAPHAALYGQIATVPGYYASAFADITKGADGSCATCMAGVGYDAPSGLGTPNVTSLLSTLAGTSAGTPAQMPPVVTSAGISGKVGTPLSFTVSVTAPNPVSYSLSGAPAGMSIGTAGVVTWATPVAGTYSVTVTAKDTTTGLSGHGIYVVTIAAPVSPVVASASISGRVGVSLSYAVTVTAANPVTYSLSGAPAGMSIGSTGIITWATPTAGTYSFIVTAKDTKTGLSGQGVFSAKISASGPVITAPAMTGVAGKPLTGTIGISDPGVSAISISISGVPLGMMFAVSGLNLTASWANPVAGNYSMKVTLLDSAGQSAQATVPITVTAK